MALGCATEHQGNGTPQVRVATVVNFPGGGDDAEAAAHETRAAVAAGADEIDVVIPYRRLLAGDEGVCTELVSRVRAECPEGRVLLKVILETGELKTAALIRRASELAISAGADFIKTSTGKEKTNATLESIDVSNNGFGAVGGTALAGALELNSTLTSLNCRGNDIGQGAAAIAEALKVNTALKKLNIGRNGLGNAADLLKEAVKDKAGFRLEV